ncbi:MAG: FAD-dependent monooxygenase [Pseudonocardiales bacterium]
MSSTSVLVVGAGPTGLAVACGLRGAGVAVQVLDRATGPAVTSRALGLQPRGVEVLARLGALGDLPARSLPIGQVVVSINGREVGRLAVGRPTRLVRQPGLLVSQAEIEAELRCHLAKLGGGASVQWGREVVGLEEDPSGVAVRLADGETLRTGWVVGCDGAHSAVRKAAHIGFPGVALVERFLLADIQAELRLPRDTVAVWLRGEDMLAAFPLPGADLWRLMAPAPTAGDAAPDLTGDAVLDALTGLLEVHAGYPAGVVRSAQWTSAFRFHRRLADTYRQGRVLLAGDAAHIHSPFGGQGLNTGIGDAENLAWKLALVTEGHAGTGLLDSYQAERRPVAAEVLASTSSMTRLVLGDTAAARLVRDRVFVPLLNRSLVQRRIWEQASQLTLSYRGGPLASPRRRSPLRGPCPGDRVPDLGCRHQDGARTQLHAELGPRWVLLAAPSPTAQDCLQLARGRLGADRVVALIPEGQSPRAVLLVRPDAHLAWRGRTSEGLRRWLAGALDPGAAQTPSPEPSRPAVGHQETSTR